MNLVPENALYAAWIAWAVTWMIAAAWANATVRTPGQRSERTYRALQILGCVGLFALYTGPHETPSAAQLAIDTMLKPEWQLQPAMAWAAVALAVAGLVFCWWARIYLGRLWSGSITRKEGHHVVDTGPYALVRHPIYTGLIAAAIATALVKASFGAVLGVALIVLALYIKGRMEERFLAQELGTEAYGAYRRRVPMLLPFGPTSR